MARLGVAYACVVAVLLGIGILVPIEDGPLAMALLLAPHLGLACLALIPIAALARSRTLSLTLALVAVLFTVRFGNEWWSAPSASNGAAELHVATWNLEAGERAGADAVAMLIQHPVDLVGLQELTPAVATAIESGPVLVERYPYRALSPSEGVAGIGLLSRFPILVSEYQLRPVRLEARVRLDDGELVVLGAHPFPARIARFAGMPSGFDPAERNADLVRIRARVAELEATGTHVLLIGDFNTAPTEPAFKRLTSGLRDAHAEAGFGPGWTWRPARFAFLEIGLLRIDLVLSTSELAPTSTSIDCPPTGDHCLVEASLTIGY